MRGWPVIAYEIDAGLVVTARTYGDPGEMFRPLAAEEDDVT
jgi:hypothetical protein